MCILVYTHSPLIYVSLNRIFINYQRFGLGYRRKTNSTLRHSSS